MNLCLITDDSPIVRKVARRILERMGFEVDEAEDGFVAFQKCQQRMPQAILLDWNMPLMNGMQFLRLLRRLPGGTDPRVVFCTTESSVGYIREALENGANEYVIKPFDAEMLQSKLAVSLGTPAAQTNTPPDTQSAPRPPAAA